MDDAQDDDGFDITGRIELLLLSTVPKNFDPNHKYNQSKNEIGNGHTKSQDFEFFILILNNRGELDEKVHDVSLDAAHEEVVVFQEVLVLVQKNVQVLIIFSSRRTGFQFAGFEHLGHNDVP